MKHLPPSLHRKTRLFLIGLLCIPFLCSCGTQKGTDHVYTAEDNLYVISRNGEHAVLNTKGEFVLPWQKEQLNILRDQRTQEPKAIQSVRTVPMEGAEMIEDYGYWDTTSYIALYDTEGKLLFDYEKERYFSAPIGDYISLHYRNEPSQFFSLSTMETALTYTDSMNVLGEYLVFQDYQNNTSKIYDQELNLVKELPGYMVSRAFKMNEGTDQEGYVYVVYDKQYHYGLLDNDFNLLLPCEYGWVDKITGHYALVENLDKSNGMNEYAIDLNTGEIVFQCGTNIHYYDGNIYMNSLFINGSWQWEFINIHHPEQNKIYKNVSYPSEYRYNSNKTPKYFVCEEENGQYTILDSEGNLIKTLDLAGDWLSLKEDYMIMNSWDGTAPAAIYTQAGKIPLEKPYSFIHDFYDQAPGTKTYLRAQYMTPQQQYLTDILDLEGNIIVEGIYGGVITNFEAEYCDGYRILCRKGFDQGLMDMEGNWLYKESIFNTFSND